MGWRYAQTSSLTIGVDDGVSDAFVGTVLAAVAHIPAAVLEVIDGAGGYLWVTRRLVEKYPSWLELPSPPGYADHQRWDAVSGVYVTECKCAVVAEEYFDIIGGGWISDSWFYPRTPLHELGHCLDHLMGTLSEHPAFRAAYDRNRQAALRDHAAACADPYNLHCFVRDDEDGPKEVFAEACCVLWCPPERRGGEMAADFARCFADSIEATRAIIAGLVQGVAA